MKRTFKIIALCLALVAFTALFTGCDALDEMKANHAILSDDRETLRFNGETYKKLPEGASLYCGESYGETYGNIAVTDEDVPVLLSTAMCHSSNYNKAKDIFSLYLMLPVDDSGIFTSYVSAYDDVTYYCNVKDYDKYTKAIENNTLDFIGIEYEVMDDDGWYYTLETLNEESGKEISEHIQNPEKMTEDVYSDIYYSSEYYEPIQSYLYKCDSEGVVAQCLDNFTVVRDEKGICYFADHITEKAVKLSEKLSAELNNDTYFYGDPSDYYPYGEWREEEYIGIIDGADSETDMVVVG